MSQSPKKFGDRCRERRRRVAVKMRPWRHHSIIGRAPLLLIIFGSLFQIPIALAQAPYRSCFSGLSNADANNDNILTQVEYSDALRLLSGGLVDVPFSSLNSQLQQTYTSRVPAGQAGIAIVTTGGNLPTETFCLEIFDGIVAQLGVTIPQQRCFIAMSVGDSDATSPPDILIREPEFVRYANQMAISVNPSYSYGGAASFTSLPTSVQTIFNDFNNGVGVPVSGSKLSTRPTDAEAIFLGNLCDQTLVAIVVGEQRVIAPTAAPVNPTQAPVAGERKECFDFDFKFCEDSMLPSDINRDNQLLELEYVRWVNFLSNSSYANQAFASLPAPLRTNYVTLATQTTTTGPQIPIFGSKPFETPTAEQQQNLENVCNSTKVAIFTQCDEPENVPTIAPVGQGTMAPVAIPQVDYITCTRSMLTSDINPRDSALQANNEYVFFTNKIANQKYAGFTFDQLPEVVREAFDFLASDGKIDITGALPGQNPSQERRDELEDICSVTLAATVGIPPSTGTSAPTPIPVPTAAPVPAQEQPVVVFNGFFIYNTEGIRAAGLVSGQNRNGLDQGYRAFIENVFNEFMASREQRLRRARGRALEILGLDSDSIDVYEIQDTDCLDSIVEENVVCQIVYGRWSVDTIREPDLDALQEELTTLSQNSILAETNGLNSFIVAANPATDVVVAGPSDDLRPETKAPTPAPPPPNPPDNRSDGGPNVGAIVGSIVGIVLVLGAGAFVYQYRRNGGEFKIPGLPKKSKHSNSGKTNEMGDDDDDAMENGGIGGSEFGRFQADSTSQGISMAGSHFPTYEEDSESQDTGTKSGGFSVQEQPPTKGSHLEDISESEAEGGAKSNAFGGFGFKRKSSAAADDGIDGLDNSHSNAGEDFENYKFDDPQNNESVNDLFNDEAGDWNSQAQGSTDWKSGAEASWGESADPDTMFSNEQSLEKSNGSESSGGDERHEDGSGSYSDEDESSDGTYDDGTHPDSIPSRQSADENARMMDEMVDNGDWDGVVGGATGEGIGEDSESSEGSFSDSPSSDESGTFDDGADPSEGADSRNLTEKEKALRDKYRLQVEELVRKVVPNEMENISAMMDQFMGREAELLKTLESMYDRSSNQRARRAVHRSRSIPQQNGRFTSGGLDGNAAVAAASTIGGGSYEDDFDGEDDGQGSYYSEDDRSGSGSYSDEGSNQDDYGDDDYEGNDRSDSRYDDESNSQGSYQEGSERSGSYSGSHSQRSGSYSDSRSGSYSQQSGSYSQQSGSYNSGSDYR